MAEPRGEAPGGALGEVLMWEAHAVAGGLDALLGWIHDRVEPRLVELGASYSLFSGDERAVIVAGPSEAIARIEDVPSKLVRRPAHQWPFTQLR